jgi:hypothetical protein
VLLPASSTTVNRTSLAFCFERTEWLPEALEPLTELDAESSTLPAVPSPRLAWWS